MKKYSFVYAILVLFIFSSCEKEAMEPEVTKGLDLNVSAKAHNQQKNLSFRAHLTGDQEVGPIDTKATGQATFKLNKDRTELSYKVIVANIEDVLMAHIHLAPFGENGQVVAWLYPSGPPPVLIAGTTNGILAEGVITSDDLVGDLEGYTLEDLLDYLIAGNSYVNVHTRLNPSGEIRGQIYVNNLK